MREKTYSIQNVPCLRAEERDVFGFGLECVWVRYVCVQGLSECLGYECGPEICPVDSCDPGNCLGSQVICWCLHAFLHH